MTVQQLRHFLAVCEEMNYTRAAEKCFLSRQALRQSISALETELKCSLFYMESNRIYLTAMGEKLQQRCAPIVKDFYELEEEMLSAGRKARLRLGVSISLIPDYLPRLSDNIRTFCERNPLLQVDVIRMKNDELAKAAFEGSIDCGLIMDMRGCARGLERVELSAHPASLFISKKNPLSSRSTVHSGEIRDTVICLPGTGPAFSPLLSALEGNGQNNEVRIVESYYQVYYLVREQNAAAVNRYIASEGKDMSDYVSNVPIEDMPPICCSFIYSAGKETEDMTRLRKHISREVRKYFREFDSD